MTTPTVPRTLREHRSIETLMKSHQADRRFARWHGGRVIGVAAAIAIVSLHAVAVADDVVDFDRDVRPILSDSCFSCHGTDANARKATLRLDTAEGALGIGKDSAVAFVGGDLTRSAAYQRIISDDADEMMPPPDSRRSLTPEQKRTVRRWIEQGAHWSEHWAFVPPKRPDPPEVERKAWLRNAIDRFVLAKFEREKIAPSPEATRMTLLRRVSFDLTGLHIHDLNATILHLLDIDHAQLIYRFQGLDFKLTGVEEHHPVYSILSP